MRAVWRFCVPMLFVLVFLNAGAFAAIGNIHGSVTDESGKPVRGAMIRAKKGIKSVTRFTQADGRYDIELTPGSYDVYVEGYAYSPKTQNVNVSQPTELNFSLKSGFSLARLTSAELETLVPDDKQTRFLRRECVSCHSFGTIQNKRGYTAAEWASFIPTMPQGRVAIPSFIPTTPGPRLTYLTTALEKYFGPTAPYFGPDSPTKAAPSDVQHVQPSDAALKATFMEYDIPTGLESYAHSILINRTGDAWFSELGRRANHIARFNMKTESFDEYDARLAHTGVEGKDGLIWYSLVAGPDLASVDPETGKIATYNIPNRKGGVHTVAVDQQGNIWCSGGAVWKFDVKTHTFTEVPVPLPKVYPKDSILAWGEIPGDTAEEILEKQNGNLIFYDVKVDSKNQVWYSAFTMSELIRVDGATLQTKAFPVPDSPSIRGLAIDGQDNVWFADYNGNALGKLDPKTGKAQLFHPPTKYAMPYGLVVDKATGNIWFSDNNGNQITEFNPNTQNFIEYRVPSNNASLHFISQDKRGRIWFTELMNGKIGVLDPTGRNSDPSTQ